MKNAAMLVFITAIAAGCGSTETSPRAAGGASSTGGTIGSGGFVSSGGASGSGGSLSLGGSIGSGGSVSSGGAISSGGSVSSGGAVGSGGSGTGDASIGGNTGGQSSTAAASGGSSSLGGQPSPIDSGAGGTMNAEPATIDDLRATCQAQADFLARCRGTTTSDSTSFVNNCVSKSGDPKVYRTDGLRLSVTCYQHWTDCINMDGCTDEVAVAINPDLQQDSAYQQCVANVTDCSGKTVGFGLGSRSCLSLILTVEAVHASLAACFSESCDTLRSCYDKVMGKAP